jgi:hypothetical protein
MAAFQVTTEAEQQWRKLKGASRLAQVVQGVCFKDGLQKKSLKESPPDLPYTTFAINSDEAAFWNDFCNEHRILEHIVPLFALSNGISIRNTSRNNPPILTRSPDIETRNHRDRDEESTSGSDFEML